MYDASIFMFTSNLERKSCSNCVQWIGQCHLLSKKIYHFTFKKNQNLNGKNKIMNEFTAVTPAPAPAMNLSEFLIYVLTGINAPTYCYKQSNIF